MGKIYLVIAGLIFTGNVWANNDLTIASNGVKAWCTYYGSNVVVGNSGNIIYKSSGYWTVDACIDDARRVDAVLSAASALGKKVKFHNGNSPSSDFTIANEDGSPAKVSPAGLTIDCDVVNPRYGVNKWLVVRFHGTEIYTTSRYEGLGGCPEDATKLRTLFNAAIATGKLVEFKSGDSPQKDFSISNESDPAGPRSDLNEHREIQDENAAAAAT